MLSRNFVKQLKRVQVRQFSSSLLVPLQQKGEVPAEMLEGFPLTTAYFNELDTEFKAFNEKCVDEFKEMNQTRIQNIIDAGGIEGWDDSSNDAITKTFEFDSFEEAQAFVQTVGKFAEKNDHHPEWKTTNGGKGIEVRLTSHFANAVTLYDFELAEHMNTSFNDTKSTFKMFPKISDRTLVNMCIATGTFVFTFSVFQWYTSQPFESDVQRGSPLPMGQVKVEIDNSVLARMTQDSNQNVLPIKVTPI